MKKISFFILILAVLILSGCAQDLNVISAGCTNNGGYWMQEYLECSKETTSSWNMKAWCTDRGGTFNDCASPCRHAADKSNCATVCIHVCVFQK